VRNHSNNPENQHQPRYEIDPDPEAPRPVDARLGPWSRDVKIDAGEHPAVTDDDLARYLLEGEIPLVDERLCLCGHLEADHRVLTDRCSRCVRCTGFAVEPSWDITVEQPVPTLEDMEAELAAARERQAALEAEIVRASEERR